MMKFSLRYWKFFVRPVRNAFAEIRECGGGKPRLYVGAGFTRQRRVNSLPHRLQVCARVSTKGGEKHGCNNLESKYDGLRGEPV